MSSLHLRMDLPEEKGTYILIAQAPQMKRVEIGSLGKFYIAEMQ